MRRTRSIFHTDFGQLLLAFASIVLASFFGALTAGLLLLWVVS